MKWTYLMAILMVISIVSTPPTLRGAGEPLETRPDENMYSDFDDDPEMKLYHLLYQNLELRVNYDDHGLDERYELEEGETATGTVNIINRPEKEFRVKLLLLRSDWIPEAEELFYDRHHGHMSRDSIEFYDDWYRKIEKGTSNVYTLEYDEIVVTENDIENNISYSFSVERGGDYFLYVLVNPTGYDRWIRLRDSVYIKAERPTTFYYSYGFIIFPILVSTSLLYAVYKVKEW